MKKDSYYLEKALEIARKSFEAGSFPAGALIVRKGEIVSEAISAQFPKINLHAESKAIDLAIDNLNQQLTDCILYTSMQPCLMCFSRSYWAGIRRIVFSLKKENTIDAHYEGKIDAFDLKDYYNSEIELIYNSEFEQESLNLVKNWETLNMQNN